MTQEPHETIPRATMINNEYLRMLVREAVERELLAYVAPIRQQQQVNEGGIRQLNRDYGALSETVNDLSAIVRGDDKLGIPGLMKTVDNIAKQLSEYGKKLEQYNTNLSNLSLYIRVGFAVLTTLGLIDNERLGVFFAAILRAIGLGT